MNGSYSVFLELQRAKYDWETTFVHFYFIVDNKFVRNLKSHTMCLSGDELGNDTYFLSVSGLGVCPVTQQAHCNTHIHTHLKKNTQYILNQSTHTVRVRGLTLRLLLHGV